MPHTQRLIVASLALVLGVGFGLLLGNYLTIENNRTTAPSLMAVTSENQRRFIEFQTALRVLLTQAGVSQSQGFTAEVLQQALPGVEESDFNGVETALGRYEYKDGALLFSGEAAGAGFVDDITSTGLQTFRDNVYRRLEKDIISTEPATVLTALLTPPEAPLAPVVSRPECTEEAKLCPDGTSVFRTGPQCEFAACPVVETSDITTCKNEQRGVDACIELYAPVCAAVAVECITTPCDAVVQTFPNSCFACSEERVTGYVDGACTATGPTPQ